MAFIIGRENPHPKIAKGTILGWAPPYAVVESHLNVAQNATLGWVRGSLEPTRLSNQACCSVARPTFQIHIRIKMARVT